MRWQRLVLKTRKAAKRTTNRIRSGLVGLRGGSPRVAIVSCDRFLGKVYDDLLLQGEFLRQGFKAQIVSWQDSTVNWADFDAAVVGSMWGYQNFLPDFERWLGIVENQTVLINPAAVIRANYDKARQLQELQQAKIPVIPTQVIRIDGLDRFELPDDKFIIKPAISGSGENTFLVKNRADFAKLRGDLRSLNQTRELLVQPFVPEIRAGELGIIVIGGEIVNVVRRFPGVIEGEYQVQAVQKAQLSQKIRELVQSILALPEYKVATYLRIDVVEREGLPIVMEVEAFEPQLYYYLLQGASRKQVLARMVAEVAQKI